MNYIRFTKTILATCLLLATLPWSCMFLVDHRLNCDPEEAALKDATTVLDQKQAIERLQVAKLNESITNMNTKVGELGNRIQDYLNGTTTATVLTTAQNAFNTANSSFNLAFGNYVSALEGVFSARSNQDDKSADLYACTLRAAHDSCCVDQKKAANRVGLDMGFAQFRLTQTQGLIGILAPLDANFTSAVTALQTKYKTDCQANPSSVICGTALGHINSIKSAGDAIKGYLQNQRSREATYKAARLYTDSLAIVKSNELERCLPTCPK